MKRALLQLFAALIITAGCDRSVGEQEEIVYPPDVDAYMMELSMRSIKVAMLQGVDTFITSDIHGHVDDFWNMEPCDSFIVVRDTSVVKMMFHDAEVLRVEQADTSTYHLVVNPMDTTLFDYIRVDMDFLPTKIDGSPSIFTVFSRPCWDEE